MRTAFTEVFGIEHPIVCGGMTAVGTAELIGAVADAGALGFLTALTQPTPEARAQQRKMQKNLILSELGLNASLIDPTMYQTWDVGGEVTVRYKTRVAGRPYTIQEQVLELEDERFESPEEAVRAFAALCERLASLALSREPRPTPPGGAPAASR